MSIAVKARFPDKDETLKPSTSEVLWTKHRRVAAADGEHMRRRWCVPVICGRCKKERDVPVLTGLSRDRELASDDLKRMGAGAGECAGYCRACWLKYFRRDLKLPDESEVFFSEWNENGLPVFCGACKTKNAAECDPPASYEEFTLPCPSCNHLIGMVEHPSGARVLWLDRKAAEPHLLTLQRKVAFICAHCGGKHYTFAHNTTLPTWRGRADECKRGAGDPKAVIDDMSLVETRSRIHYSQRKGARVPVICGLCLFSHNVEKVNWFSFDYTRFDGFTGYCRPHPRREIAAALRALAQKDNGHKNGGAEKRGRGRQPKATEVKTDEARQLLARISSTITKLKTEGAKRSDVTSNYVARKLNIGDIAGGDLMMKQLNRGKVKIKWPELRDGIWDDSTEIQEFLSSHSTEIQRINT